jgi:hypothetical protein
VVLVALTLAVSSAPAVEARPSPVPREERAKPADDKTFAVESSRSWIEDGDLTIVADIRNRTRDWRKSVRGLVTYYTKAGKAIGSHVAPPQELYAAPRGHMSVKYFTSTIPAGYHHYRLTFTSKAAKKRPIAKKLAVVVGQVALDEFGFLEVPVSVTNQNGHPVQHVAVHVALFDRKGKILTLFNGYNYTDPSVLQPGQTGSITITIGSHFEGVERVNVRVEAKG